MNAGVGFAEAKSLFIPPDPDEIRPSVSKYVSGTTLHSSVRFQHCYGCYPINPLEGSDCCVANYRHRQLIESIKHGICRGDDFALCHPKSAKKCTRLRHVIPLTNPPNLCSKCKFQQSTHSIVQQFIRFPLDNQQLNRINQFGRCYCMPGVVGATVHIKIIAPSTDDG